MDLVERYRQIMKQYRTGAFGTEHLTMYQILTSAGEPYLFDKMTPEDLDVLIDESTGFTRQMLSEIRKAKTSPMKPYDPKYYAPDSEAIAERLSKFEYHPEKRDEILKKYESL